MTYWIVPCNTKYYDVFGAFEKSQIIDWKQTNPNIDAGDQIFIYVGAPVKAIAFRCKVLEANLKERAIDDSEFALNADQYVNAPLHMRIKLVSKYENNILSYDTMQSHGEKGSIMCQRRMGEGLIKFVETIDSTQ